MLHRPGRVALVAAALFALSTPAASPTHADSTSPANVHLEFNAQASVSTVQCEGTYPNECHLDTMTATLTRSVSVGTTWEVDTVGGTVQWDGPVYNAGCFQGTPVISIHSAGVASIYLIDSFATYFGAGVVRPSAGTGVETWPGRLQNAYYVSSDGARHKVYGILIEIYGFDIATRTFAKLSHANASVDSEPPLKISLTLDKAGTAIVDVTPPQVVTQNGLGPEPPGAATLAVNGRPPSCPLSSGPGTLSITGATLDVAD